MALAGLWAHGRREPQASLAVADRELRLVKKLLGVLVIVALMLSPLRGDPRLLPVIAVDFILWTVLGFALTALSLGKGVVEVGQSYRSAPS